jgi:hypothetical protein
MTQSCRDSQDVKISSVVRMIKRNIYYLLIAGQRSLLAISNVGAQRAISNMQVRGLVAPLSHVDKGIMRAPPGIGSSDS